MSGKNNDLFKWVWLGFLFSLWGFASEVPSAREPEIRRAISAAIPGADITFPEGIDSRAVEAKTLLYSGDSGAGLAYFLADGKQIKIPYSAHVSALAAVRRISPLERLSPELFVETRIDLARPENRLLRGLTIDRRVDLTEYEAAQTVLPGHPLTSPMTRKAPLVRRGDVVELQVTSGGVTLKTSAIAQEPGLAGEKIRVLTRQTKREFSAKLISKDRVEVSL